MSRLDLLGAGAVLGFIAFMGGLLWLMINAPAPDPIRPETPDERVFMVDCLKHQSVENCEYALITQRSYNAQ